MCMNNNNILNSYFSSFVKSSIIAYPGHKCVFLCVGAFEDEDIIHVEGNVDPVRDIEIIHEELRLKDEESLGPIIDKLEKTAVRGGDKKLKPEYVSRVCVGWLMSALLGLRLRSEAVCVCLTQALETLFHAPS